jgi:sulfonate transport system substrate-binding protein
MAACGSEGSNGTPASDGGGAESSADETVTIRIGHNVASDLIKYYMKTDPEYADNLGEAYALEWSEFSGVAPAVQALSAGTVDVATVSAIAAGNAIQQGADLLITGQTITEKEGWASSQWLTLNDSGIDGPEDMPGRTWSTAGVGNTGYFAFRHWLSENGVEEGEYDIIESPFPIQEEILRAGEGDIGEFVPPFTINAMESGDFKVIVSAVDIIGEWAGLLSAFRQEFVDEHPEAVEAFMEDWQKVANFVRDPANKDAVLASTEEVTGVPQEDLQFLLTREDFFRPEDGRVDIERLQAAWDQFHEWGGMPEQLDATEHVWAGWQ